LDSDRREHVPLRPAGAPVAINRETVEDAIVIENLIDARKSRRKIIELLRKQQVDDSYCSERLKQVALDGKRRLLGLLAAWLVSFELDKEFSESDRGMFAAIKTELSLEGWISLQRREAELSEKTMAARSVEDELYKVYHRVAPNGAISIWLLKGAEKAKAEHLQEDYRSAKAVRESLEREVVVVLADIQKAIGRFLRDAVSPESLVLLAKESGIKRELSSLLQELEKNGISVWGAHAQKQLSSLCELQNESAGLSQVYSAANA